MDLTKLTKKQLEKEINEYENLQCFGVNDLRYKEMLYAEVEKRGYEITSSTTITLN